MKREFFLSLFLSFFLLNSCGDKKTAEPPTVQSPAIQQNIQKVPSASKPQSAEDQKTLQNSTGDLPKNQNAESLFNLSDRLIQQGDIITGFKYLEKSIQTGEKSGKPIPKAYLMRGVIYQDYFKNYQCAIPDYEKYLTLDNMGEHRINALERIAKAYSDWGMLYRKFFNATVNLYIDYYTYKLQTSARSSPEEMAFIRYSRGMGYYLSQRYDKSISDLEKVSAGSQPYRIQARIKLAACYYKKGFRSKAEQIWSQAGSNDIPISSELWRTYLEAGKALKSDEISKQCQKMSQWLDAQKVKKDAYNQVGRNIAHLYYTVNELDKALEQFRNVDMRCPDFTVSNVKFFQPSPFESRAKIYFCKASEYYLKCLQTQPAKSDYYKYQIGLCLLRADKIDEAIKAFNEISDMDLKPKASINIAVSFYRKGETQKAYQIWDQVANTGNKESLGELGYVYAKLGIRLQDALKYTEGNDDPLKSAFTHFQLGFETKGKAQKIEQFEEAIQILERSRPEVGLYLEKNDPLLLVDLANAYYQRRYFSISAEIWSHFLDRYPEVYQIFDVTQLISEIWHSNWKESAISDISWVNLST